MNQYITKFSDTGICEINVDNIAKRWNDNFVLYKYHEEYKLVKYRKRYTSRYFKIQISEEQARQLIDKLKLLPVRDTLLVHSRTFHTEEFLLKEISRVEDIFNEKKKEVEFIEKELINLRLAI